VNKIAYIALISIGMTYFGFTSPVSADTPVQVSLFYPIQIFQEFEDVKGVRINAFYGVNGAVSGLDVGFVNRTTYEQKGLQIGFFNMTEHMSGLQIGLFNRTEWLNGIQIGFLNMNVNGDHKLLPFFNFSF